MGRKHTLGDLGGSEAGLDQDIATLGTEGGSNGLSQGVDTSEEGGTALNAELELLYSYASAIHPPNFPVLSVTTNLVSEAQLLAKTGTSTVLGSCSRQSRGSGPGTERALHDCEIRKRVL